MEITRRAALASACALLAGCGGGAYMSGRRPPPGRVLIFPVHVTLGERRLGGEFRLRRDWSEAVRRPVMDAAITAVRARRRRPVFIEDPGEADAAWALARLHRPVAESLMGFDAQLTGGEAPATRGRPGLGAGGAALARRHDAPTGLFISVTGERAEGWQRAAEIVVREAMDFVVTGLERRLIVSLAELETGEIYWSMARRDRRINDPARAAKHTGALIARAGFRAGAPA